MTSCHEQAISHGTAAYADFLQYGPNANPDPFFLPNVFANDTDEVYPVANWWLCGSPSHLVGQQDGSLSKPLNYGAAEPSELSRVHCSSLSHSPVQQDSSLPKPLNCVASSCTSSTRTRSGGSPCHSPGWQDGSLRTPLNYGAAGPSEFCRLAMVSERRDCLRCTSPTVAPSIASTEGRRRRSRRPSSTTSSLSTATVGGSFRTTPAGRTDGGVGNGPVGRVGSNREQGEHGFRRGSGRSFSTPRFRTVSENGDGVEEAPARRGSEDDGALVRMKEHQELKNLLRAYQSSFLASYGRCAPLVAALLAARVKEGGARLRVACRREGPGPGPGGCGPTPHQLWLSWPSVSLHLAPSRRTPSRRTQATAVRPRLEAGLGAVPALPDVANGALRRPRCRVERW